MIRDINNERAKSAYEFVSKFNDIADDTTKKEFHTLARSFPSMLQNNGLAASVAFLYSKRNKKSNGKKDSDDKRASEKKNSAHEMLYNEINRWVLKSEQEASVPEKDMQELIEMITKAEIDKYRVIYQRVMAYAQWIKRFAEGMFEA